MKNKFIAVTLSLLLTASLASCGNYNLGFGGYIFEAVHISAYNCDPVDVAIKSWGAAMAEDGRNISGIEVETVDYGTLFLSEGTYILIKDVDHCPLCDGK